MKIAQNDIFLNNMSVRERVMFFEFDLYINQTVNKAYFQNFLMNDSSISKIIHNHKYSEIHMIYGGDAEILVSGEKKLCRSGTVCVIPGEVYHCYLSASPTAQIVAFQFDMPCSDFKIREFPASILAEIFGIFRSGDLHNDCGSLEALLSYFASAFSANVSPKQSKNYAVVIYDFISKNYNKNVTLGELARILCFSEKQTERLIKKHMGCTFKKALINYKMVVADFLESNTSMTKSEIASYVGYANYSSYLKAKKVFYRHSGHMHRKLVTG